MAPPELTGNAPGLDVVHPLVVGLRPILGEEAGPSLLHRLDGRTGKGACIRVPLLGQVGLDRHTAAVTVGNGMHVLIDSFDETGRLHVGDDLPAGLETVETTVGRRHVVVEPGPLIKDADHLEIMAAANLEVVEIVRRRDLDGAASLFGVGPGIGDDRDSPAHQREDGMTPDQRRMTGIVWVNGDTCIAQHGFGTGGGNGDVKAVGSLDGVPEVPEVTTRLPCLDLKIRNRRFQAGIPVDEPLVAVDEALFMEGHEDLDDGLRQAFIHGEAFTRPVG